MIQRVTGEGRLRHQSSERRLAREHLVEGAGEAIEVAPGVDVAAADLSGVM